MVLLSYLKAFEYLGKVHGDVVSIEFNRNVKIGIKIFVIERLK